MTIRAKTFMRLRLRNLRCDRPHRVFGTDTAKAHEFVEAVGNACRHAHWADTKAKKEGGYLLPKGCAAAFFRRDERASRSLCPGLRLHPKHCVCGCFHCDRV